MFVFILSVKSVAQDQKNEIMSQLQTIRYLMKKRGMDCPPLNVNGKLFTVFTGLGDIGGKVGTPV